MRTSLRGVGNCSSLSYRWTELSVQIDSEGENVFSQGLAVLVLDIWCLSNSGSAHQGRCRGPLVLGQVLGGAQLLVAQA